MRLGPSMAAIAVVLLASGASAFGQGSGAGAACGPQGARTLAKDRGARVYETGGSVYGCATRSGRITRLGTTGDCIGGGASVNHVALAADTVAYGLHHCGVDTGFTQVLVQRLRDGARLGSFSATEKSLGPEATNFVDSLVVRADGATAWIATGQSIISPARDIEVRTGHGSHRQLLDSAPGVNTKSLRLHGSRLTWRNGGAERSAILR
jgi:hypothetical protein